MFINNVWIPEDLNVAAQNIETGASVSVSVRDFLVWFGAQRRGWRVVNDIQQALNAVDLTTHPNFEYAYIDSTIKLIKRPAVPAAQQIPESQLPPQEHEQNSIDREPVQIEESHSVDATISPSLSPIATHVPTDPSYRLGKLAAANRVPLSIKPDDSLEAATTQMLLKDYSQLPVMTTPHSVKGVISWKSIGTKLSLGKKMEYVRDCMDVPQIVSTEMSLFDAIDLISLHEYVLVRSITNQISGIVTASDLSQTLDQLATPFLFLGEIENIIRSLIEPRFDMQALRDAVDAADTSRTIASVADLTFGEYVRLLEKPTNWEKLNWKLDRTTFVKQLDEVRRIRNDVMHFDPDGIGPEDLATLETFLFFLHETKD